MATVVVNNVNYGDVSPSVPFPTYSNPKDTKFSAKSAFTGESCEFFTSGAAVFWLTMIGGVFLSREMRGA